MIATLLERLKEQADLEIEQNIAEFPAENGIVDAQTKKTIVPPAGRSVQHVKYLVNKGRIFIDLAKNPVALAYSLHAFEGNHFRVSVQAGLIVRKGALAQTLHVDRPTPYPIHTPVSLTVMYALSEYEEDMGATRVLLGQHEHNNAFSMRSEEGHIETIPMILKPGDAAFWTNRVYHGQGEAISEKPRYSVSTMYSIDFVKTIDSFPLIIHSDVAEQLDEDARRLYNFTTEGYGGTGIAHDFGAPNLSKHSVSELHRHVQP